MKKIYFAGVSLFFLLLLSAFVIAQEPAPPAAEAQPTGERLQLEKAEADRPVTNGLKIDKKITGRLPNGYKEVVTNTQRDDIYKIQKEYAELIEFLKLRIDLLEQERDQKVDALLTPEQVQKLKTSLGALESEKNKQKKAAPSKRAVKAKPAEKPAE